MSIQSVRRMAARILKAGESRIWIDPLNVDEVEKAITKDDVRTFIRKGYVKAEQKKGISRFRGRLNSSKKKKGRSSGFGKRKGTSNARLNAKGIWIARVRAQRKLLRSFKLQGALKEGYRETYLKIKGGVIKDKSHLVTFLKERNYLKDGFLKENLGKNLTKNIITKKVVKK